MLFWVPCMPASSKLSLHFWVVSFDMNSSLKSNVWLPLCTLYLKSFLHNLTLYKSLATKFTQISFNFFLKKIKFLVDSLFWSWKKQNKQKFINRIDIFREMKGKTNFLITFILKKTNIWMHCTIFSLLCQVFRSSHIFAPCFFFLVAWFFFHFFLSCPSCLAKCKQR